MEGEKGEPFNIITVKTAARKSWLGIWIFSSIKLKSFFQTKKNMFLMTEFSASPIP